MSHHKTKASRRRRPKVQKTAAWTPMRRYPLDPGYVERCYPDGLPAGITHLEAWGNDVYTAAVEKGDDGWDRISFKRLDRVAAHDWRHFQSIKNEVCGKEREAIELYPAESRLMDTSNSYHLYVAPKGVTLPWGQHYREVLTPAQLYDELVAHGAEQGNARQREFQPGLSTGPSTEAAPHEPGNL